MKKILALLFACSALLAQNAEVNDGTPAPPPTPPDASPSWVMPHAVLHDNGPMITHPTGGSGGAPASALQSAILLNVYGFAHASSGSFRVADQFTAPMQWTVDSITVFAYQTGSTTTSTLNSFNFRIWDGVPGAGGSNVVFGDTTTNRLSATGWTGIYRVLDTAMTTTNRPIMYARADLGGLILPPGTYWLDWQTGGSLGSGPWVPPVSVLGSTTTGDAQQYSGSAWGALLDTGTNTPQGLPFIIEGSDIDVPTLSQWGLMAFLLTLVGSALVMMRRRRAFA